MFMGIQAKRPKEGKEEFWEENTQPFPLDTSLATDMYCIKNEGLMKPSTLTVELIHWHIRVPK